MDSGYEIRIILVSSMVHFSFLQLATAVTQAVCRLVATCPAALLSSPTTTPSATAWTATETLACPTWVSRARLDSSTVHPPTRPTAVSIKVITPLSPTLLSPTCAPFPFDTPVVCLCLVLFVCFFFFFWECVLLDKRRGDSGGWTPETSHIVIQPIK